MRFVVTFRGFLSVTLTVAASAMGSIALGQITPGPHPHMVLTGKPAEELIQAFVISGIKPFMKDGKHMFEVKESSFFKKYEGFTSCAENDLTCGISRPQEFNHIYIENRENPGAEDIDLGRSKKLTEATQLEMILRKTVAPYLKKNGMSSHAEYDEDGEIVEYGDVKCTWRVQAQHPTDGPRLIYKLSQATCQLRIYYFY